MKENSRTLVSTLPLDEINRYFQEISTDPNYTAPQLLEVPDETRIPMVDKYSILELLTRQKRSPTGPDVAPYWLWRNYADYLAPVITRMIKCSLRNQEVPHVWKLTKVSPIPKETPVFQKNQLRPISVPNVIMGIFERLDYNNEMSAPISSHITSDQHAYRQGQSTTTALLKCQKLLVKMT